MQCPSHVLNMQVSVPMSDPSPVRAFAQPCFAQPCLFLPWPLYYGWSSRGLFCIHAEPSHFPAMATPQTLDHLDTQDQGCIAWYEDQVVLLTGATGSLGICLLYKLAIQLPTAKIYVLCRGTVQEAMQKWEASIPEQIDEILDSGKVHCLKGDMNCDGFGLDAEDLALLQSEVTIVVHAAANISLAQSLAESVASDTLPVVRLGDLAQTFRKLRLFVHISSTFAQMHLPGGTVEEKINLVDEHEPAPRVQLDSILATGKSPYTSRFITPYGHGKYLAERLLLEYEDRFPILIVRPSSISPALRHPYPLYGPDGSIPLHTFVAITIARGFDFWEAIRVLPQRYIFDEIPVDFVANLTLLHAAAGTTGIVHAAAQMCVPYTVAEIVEKACRYTSKERLERLGATGKVNSTPRQLPLEFHNLLTESWRDWIFDCKRSLHLMGTKGPIGLEVPCNFEDLFRQRTEKWSKALINL